MNKTEIRSMLWFCIIGKAPWLIFILMFLHTTLNVQLSAQSTPLNAEFDKYVENTIKELKSKGARLKKVQIDIEELIEWCKYKHYAVDAKSRSLFTAYKIMKQDEDKKKST